LTNEKDSRIYVLAMGNVGVQPGQRVRLKGKKGKKGAEKAGKGRGLLQGAVGPPHYAVDDRVDEAFDKLSGGERSACAPRLRKMETRYVHEISEAIGGPCCGARNFVELGRMHDWSGKYQHSPSGVYG
jgi:hypothetical protein